MYTKEQTNFILYHNRSFEGVTANFVPKIKPEIILDIQSKMNFCREIYTSDEASIDFDKNDFLFESEDIIIKPKDIHSLKNDIMKAHRNIKGTVEYDYLMKRGITDKQIKKHLISPMSLITDENKLDIIGGTTHPMLGKILGDGIEGGAVLFPLVVNKKLINICLRRLDNKNKMKYALSVPDINFWGINKVKKNKHIWIAEGNFDKLAMEENGLTNVITASTPTLSPVHLYQLLEKKPTLVNVWVDNDKTGFRTGATYKKFLSLNNIPCETYVSEEEKDAFDHFKYLTLDDIYPINITLEKINQFDDSEIMDRVKFDFVDYLKNRKY